MPRRASTVEGMIGLNASQVWSMSMDVRGRSRRLRVTIRRTVRVGDGESAEIRIVTVIYAATALFDNDARGQGYVQRALASGSSCVPRVFARGGRLTSPSPRATPASLAATPWSAWPP